MKRILQVANSKPNTCGELVQYVVFVYWLRVAYSSFTSFARVSFGLKSPRLRYVSTSLIELNIDEKVTNEVKMYFDKRSMVFEWSEL